MDSAVYFNPPTPCGVGPPLHQFDVNANGISIHPPRVGWDGNMGRFALEIKNFNPPTPCGVGRSLTRFWNLIKNFNPPTPCGVGPREKAQKAGELYFNPPTPCGVGHLKSLKWTIEHPFQSTHPVWGGTYTTFPSERCREISIHPPRVGWDAALRTTSSQRLGFQSTHPVWGGTVYFLSKTLAVYFNPPTPCGVGRRDTTNLTIK